MKKLMKGNEAIAEAAIQAGCRFFFGYPITPQNQIPEYMSKRMPEVGGCFLQSESEVAAINMVYGAGGAGARVMTSSSSPGISLKQEGISYIVGAEVPCVIVNMVRGGPGLGSIQPAQSDYYQSTRGGGHGDYRMCVLAPSSVQEAVDLTQEAFDIADRYRNPVMVLGDGLIGQMMEPVDMDLCKDRKPAEDLTEKTWAATGHVPTEEAPRAIINSLYIQPDVLEKHCQKLQAKYDAIEAAECRWQEEETEDAEIVIVAYGTTSRICRSAMRKLRQEGIRVGMIRPITLWPFPEAAIRSTLKTARQYLCVEMSMGQMIDDVRLAVNGERPVDFYGRTGGMVPTVTEIVDKVKAMYDNDDLHKAEKAFNDTVGAVGNAFNKLGQKIEKAVNNPELEQKAENFRKQASDVANRAASGLAKGMDAMASTLGKAFSSIFGGAQPEEPKSTETVDTPAENNEGGEQ
ncbi:MAG: 3-methyl-2-oxobutanoate dehydrogenase subunit VorB [Clostridia bacterium]|nr:3-methyl-2-oxobutanoate dehydrogenase subunit VorB [Clostridia bacterium]